MVARGNPLGIRNITDLANPGVRFANREPGAALRVLLDDQLKTVGLAPEAIRGYNNEVFSHREGAFRIACNVADAALGLRVVAEVFDLGFVPIMAVRCDLVIPEDLFVHPSIQILLDTLQFRRPARLRQLGHGSTDRRTGGGRLCTGVNNPANNLRVFFLIHAISISEILSDGRNS